MSKFHVGDEVRITGSDFHGKVGVIVEPPSTPDSERYDYWLRIGEGARMGFNEHELRPADIKALESDPVNHPSHYTRFGAEVIDITEHLSFNAGNAVKYLARAGFKDPSKHLEDLEKSAWYVSREIERVKREQNSD
jgi:hypothetical protein